MPQLARSESASAGSGFSWKPWMRPSAPVITTPNWLVSRDPLGGQGGDPVVGLVELAHRAEVDVGEGVAGDHQEGVAEEAGGVADPARRCPSSCSSRL